MNISKFERFKKIFEPKTVAFYGASRSFMRFGSFNMTNLVSGGYSGEIYPIHPKYDTVLGTKAYKSILDIPDDVEIDLVVYVAPIQVLAEKVIDEIGQRGIKNIICVSAGLKEIGNYEISDLLKNKIKKYDITFLGPNCIGWIVPKQKIYCTPMPIYHPPGNIAILSQSGSFAAHTFMALEQIPFRVSKVLSVGNCITTDLTDCLEVIEDDPESEFIGLYIEGIRRGREFVKVAKRVSLKKPIVAVQIGRGEAGMLAAFSHTAAVSTPSYLFQSICNQTGIINVENTMDMLNILYTLTQQPLPRGKRVGIITVGGGPGTLIADLCEKHGLEVPLLSEETQSILKEKYLPFTGSSKNPVDITFAQDFNNFYKYVPRTVLRSGEVDALIFYGLFSAQFWTRAIKNLPDYMKNDSAFSLDEMDQMRNSMNVIMDQSFRGIERLGEKFNVPILFTAYNDRSGDDSIDLARKYHLPVLFPFEAPIVLAKLSQYEKWLQKNLE
jgi:acyl-CoA synthetase (NDP forming)